MSSIKEIITKARSIDTLDIVNAAESYPNDQELGRWLRDYIEKRAVSMHKSHKLSINKKK